MKKKFKTKGKGFTLVEIALVLSISTIIGFITFSNFLKQTENKRAIFAGQEIKMIGNATDAYISNHYDSLSTLSNSTGNTEDIGPRTCSSSTNTCTITVKTLMNEGLLPSTYSGTNIYGSGYSIILKRSGISPYYKVYGLVTTNNTLATGNNIRYDLLGQAMQEAGVDSGMTRNSSSTVEGYNGSWSASVTDYSNITKSGQLAYQAGYGTYNYSVFLRRDGSLPMTGSLNMGNNDITNAKNITASGTTTSGTLTSTGATNVGTDLTVANDETVGGNSTISGNQHINGNGYVAGKLVVTNTIYAGGQITAHNRYGDALTIGGDDNGEDYSIRLAENKPLTIYTPNETSGSKKSTLFQVFGGNAVFYNNISTNDIDPNDYPSAWGGGIRTNDVIANGTFATLKPGTTGAEGNFAAYMNQSGEIWSSGNITSDSTVSGKYIMGNYTPTLGASCDTNGIQGHMSSGMPVYCINKTWQTIGSNIRIVTNNATNADWVAAYCNSDEVVIGGGGTSYGGPVGFTNTDGQDVAPGMDASVPLDGLNGWKVSGMNQSPGDTLTVYAICMKKY